MAYRQPCTALWCHTGELSSLFLKKPQINEGLPKQVRISLPLVTEEVFLCALVKRMRCPTYVTVPFPTQSVNDHVKQEANSLSNKYYDYDAAGLIYLLTAIGLTTGGSSTVHILHTNITQDIVRNKDQQDALFSFDLFQ